MLIYEINIELDREIAAEYATLVSDHKEKLLAEPGFSSFEWFERRATEEPGAHPSRLLWTLHYRVESQKALQAYLDGLGQALREEGPRRFPGRISVSRRILHSVP